MLPLYKTTEWLAFVNAIRKDPADVTRRLVAADWLDEQGQSDHALYVRTVCERERLEQLTRGRLVVPPGAEVHKGHRCPQGVAVKEFAETCPRCRWMIEFNEAEDKIPELNKMERELEKKALKYKRKTWLPTLVQSTLRVKEFVVAANLGRMMFRGGFVVGVERMGVHAIFPEEKPDELFECQPVSVVRIHRPDLFHLFLFGSAPGADLATAARTTKVLNELTARWPAVQFEYKNPGGRGVQRAVPARPGPIEADFGEREERENTYQEHWEED